MKYVALIRTKRHYNFQQDFDTIESFDKEMEKEKKRIVWASLFYADSGNIIKKIDGYYI